jgi:hypothetical protein
MLCPIRQFGPHAFRIRMRRRDHAGMRDHIHSAHPRGTWTQPAEDRRPVTSVHASPVHGAVLALQRSAGNKATAAAFGGKTIYVSRCGDEQHPGCPCASGESEELVAPQGITAQRDEEANENNPSELGAEGGAISEGTCQVLPDAAVVGLVRAYFAVRYPRASNHLVHYLQGSGTPFVEDVGALFGQNPRAGARVAGMIRDRGGSGTGQLVGRTTSSAIIRQSDYDNEDWRLSLGGVDEIDYQVLDRDDSGGTQVELSIHDPYEWHPAEDRGSQCLHQAMENQKAKGAKNYNSEGSATVRLQL